MFQSVAGQSLAQSYEYLSDKNSVPLLFELKLILLL